MRRLLKTIRENVMAVFHRETPERIPWLTYDIPYPMLPRGSWERELRNKGLGIIVLTGFYPCGNLYIANMPNVEIEQRLTVERKRTIIKTIYHTPIGSVSKREDLSISPPNPWILEYPIKSLSDYDVVKFIFEDTVYQPNYEAFTWLDKHVGDDGFVRVDCGYTPFQELLIRFMGYQRCAIEVYRHQKEFIELISVLGKKFEERVRIVVDSPGEVVGVGDNINARITSPKLFKRYVLPFYQRAAEILHGKGKIMSVHMDGALSALKDLIPKTGIDVVEAFTPPPVGDLPLSEARAAWGDRIIIEANFPESVCHNGMEAVKKCTMSMLKTVAPGEGFLLSVTEDIPYREPYDVLEQTLRTITNVMWKYGRYPIKL